MKELECIKYNQGRLIITHHFLLNRTVSFEDAANALITIDRTLNQGRNINTISDIFYPQRNYSQK